jgi:hypothetical protein
MDPEEEESCLEEEIQYRKKADEGSEEEDVDRRPDDGNKMTD